jgi:subtilase family serine protease
MDFGDEALTQGDVVSLRLLVRNAGQADATMVSVRCQANDQLIGVQTVPLIQPGELRAVTCDWQIPNDVEVVRFNAIIDRGFEILEGDEENNEIESLVAINQAQDDGASSQDEGGVSGVLGVGFVLLAVGLLALLAYFMPAKVKKIE